MIIADASGETTSDAAMLTVLPPANTNVPMIAVQPRSQGVTPGGSVTLFVVVSNTVPTPVTYRWMRDAQLVATRVAEHVSAITITNLPVPPGTYTVEVAALGRPPEMSAPAVLTVLTDADGDRLPDAWQAGFAWSSTALRAPLADPDADGMNNLQEYLAGTNPLNASSRLRLATFELDGKRHLQFRAPPDRICAIEWSPSLAKPEWRTGRVILPGTTEVLQTVVIPETNRAAFYRLVTPPQ